MNLNRILLAAVLLAHLPMTLALVDRMWGSGHYQYFPIALLVIGWLIWIRAQSSTREICTGTGGVVACLLAADVVILSIAVIFQSMMATAISLFLFSGISIYAIWGGGVFLSVLPAWLLCLLIIPLPAGLDDKLVLSLQFVASSLASLILDGIGQIHFRQGVILVTEKNQFLTEEACSGIRSLFSSITAIAMLGVYKRYGIVRHLLNLAQVVCWVIVGNGIRVAIVVYVADNYTKAIATGWTHDFVGLLVFFFIFAMALSTDCLINLLILSFRKRPVENDEVSEVVAATQISPILLWGKATGLPSLLASPLMVCFILAYSAAAVFSARLEYVSKEPFATVDITTLPVSAQSDMPLEVAGWRVEGFEHIFRGQHQLEATDSYVWRLKNGDVSAVLSIDSPWTYWHDLTNCYRGLGWQTNTLHVFNDTTNLIDRSNLPSDDGYSIIEMSNGSGEMGRVLFASFDRDSILLRPILGTSLYSVDLLWQRALGNFKRVLGVDLKAARRFDSGRLPVSTIQVTTSKGREITRDELAMLEKLFFESRRILLGTSRFGG